MDLKIILEELTQIRSNFAELRKKLDETESNINMLFEIVDAKDKTVDSLSHASARQTDKYLDIDFF